MKREERKNSPLITRINANEIKTKFLIRMSIYSLVQREVLKILNLLTLIYTLICGKIIRQKPYSLK